MTPTPVPGSGLSRETYADPVAAAETAAEGVRALNHATLWDGYAYAADLDSVIASLAVMAQRLPQAFTQAVVWTQRAHDAGGIGHDQGASVNAAVTELVLALTEATRHAAHLADALTTAQATSAHLSRGAS